MFPFLIEAARGLTFYDAKAVWKFVDGEVKGGQLGGDIFRMKFWHFKKLNFSFNCFEQPLDMPSAEFKLLREWFEKCL